MLLYFGGQGAGFLAWPFVVGSSRLFIAAAIGWLAVVLGAGVGGLFLIVSASMAAFGIVNSIVITFSSWMRRDRVPKHGRQPQRA